MKVALHLCMHCNACRFHYNIPKVQLSLSHLLTNNGVCVEQYCDLGIKRGIKWKLKKFNSLNGHTSHVIPNPIGLKGKVIKVVPSYFCGGVYDGTPCQVTAFRFNKLEEFTLHNKRLGVIVPEDWTLTRKELFNAFFDLFPLGRVCCFLRSFEVISPLDHIVLNQFMFPLALAIMIIIWKAGFYHT